MKKASFILFLSVMGSLLCCPRISAQRRIDTLTLDIEHAITRANDSSLLAFSAKNLYLANYWEYQSFKADRLTSLSLNLTPLSVRRDFTTSYNSTSNLDVYRQQQSFQTSGGLALQQNLDVTGGTFFVDSQLGYVKNVSSYTYQQFSSVPFRVGYRQDLVGYNRFKWEKKIAPIKFEKAQKELVSKLEETSENVVGYFFDLAMAQAQFDLARENEKNTEKLYRLGEEKYKIASLQQSDLFTLKLDRINAQNTVQSAQIALKNATLTLLSALNYDKSIPIKLKLPDYPKDIEISTEDALAYARQNNPLYLDSSQQSVEMQQKLNKAKREAMFNIGLSASVGFNQISESLTNVYNSPLQQDIVSITAAVPLLDWGVRRGRYKMAKNNMDMQAFTAKQNQVNFERDVIIAIDNFKIQQQMIGSAEEAVKLAKAAYQQIQAQFAIGKVDLNSITLSTSRWQQAQQNYITALKNYWQNYFKIRKLTLFDFEKRLPITFSLEWNRFGSSGQ